MATAPSPGVGKRKKKAEQAKQLHTITIRGEKTYPSTPYRNLPLHVLADVRDQTGRPLDYWLYPISGDSVRVLCWVAVRVNEDPDLSFSDFEASWLDEYPDLTPKEIEILEDDGRPDDPQP